MKIAQGEGALDPKKAPGTKRKLDEIAMKLLEEDLRVRPTATYEQRAEFLDEFLGVRGDQVHHLPDDQAPGLLPKKIGRRERERRVAEGSLEDDDLHTRCPKARIRGRDGHQSRKSKSRRADSNR
jgi:hypothetical protein